MKKNKGFTLIELLVVIAIIGILASVVLASLSSARNKGKDAAVKSQLSSMRAQAEIFYSTAETYVGICTGDIATVPGAFGGTGGLLTAIVASEGVSTSVNAVNTVAGNAITSPYSVTCHSVADAWVAEAPLVSVAAVSPATVKMYCVDSTGASKETSTAIAADATVCPTN
ncbi:MAG: type II secretion system protein [Candidatus Nomurabacteria bacterium]|nr:type II secretion system protein [Candidatus Nomurabacteria bacterium]